MGDELDLLYQARASETAVPQAQSGAAIELRVPQRAYSALEVMGLLEIQQYNQLGVEESTWPPTYISYFYLPLDDYRSSLRPRAYLELRVPGGPSKASHSQRRSPQHAMLTGLLLGAWARHEPPTPDGESTGNPVHTFLGTSNFSQHNESQQHLNPNSAQTNKDGSSRTSSVRPANSDVASMASSAPDQLSEAQREGQPGWWPFSLPLPPLPIPLRKNSGQQGQGSGLTSPFQSLFSQTQWSSGKGAEKDDADPEADGSAGAGITGGDDNAEGRPKKDRPRVQWLFDRAQMRRQGMMTEDELRAPPRDQNEEQPSGSQDGDDNTETAQNEGEERNEDTADPPRRRMGGMHISLPRRNKGPFTLANSKTPGWDQPWAPTTPAQARTRGQRGSKEGSNVVDYARDEDDSDDADPAAKTGKLGRSRQTLRRWILHNNSVPLLIRILNISFTTSTLAIAISIRRVERSNDLLGVIGSSPILAIIFAPLTLVHVISSVYLEYFGKPLGLWRTSGKLFHTLLEMLFICMWSAELSLAFDNYFTTRLGCSPAWTTRWWDRMSPPQPIENEGRGDGGPADQLCYEQLALVCLVFFGLLWYCGSLVISLFRIFEKLKGHASDSSFRRRSFGLGGLGSRLGMV